MKKILAILMLLMLNLNIALAQNLEIDETNLSEKDIQYLSAWTSLAVYNDKFSLLARDILKSNGWNIRFYNEQIAKSDVKYLLADKKINDKDIFFLSISGTSSWQDVKTDLAVEATVFQGHNLDEFLQSRNDKDLSETKPLVHKGFLQYVQDGFFSANSSGATVFQGHNLDEFLQSRNDKDLSETKPLVHKGFLQYVQDGFFSANSSGEILGLDLVEHLKQCPEDKIYITGHSLGGAVAELLTARLLDMGVNSNQIETITFGAPAVGNKTFVDLYEPKMNLTRITMKGDIVKNLAQIANERFVQFNTNEVWTVSKLENDKFAHNMLLYFDRAIKNYYDSKEDIALATEDIETCETYVAKPKYDFPNELQSEINYMNLALKDKLLKEDEDCFVDLVDDDLSSNVFQKAKALNAKYVVFYEFSANKIKDSTSNKRYYIYGSKYIYDINGNLIRGFSATSDTKEMTVLQSVLYLECQFK